MAKAKQEVLAKEDAHSLARQLKIHLSEYGGTGQGIIGALAGVGLRLGKNDGRVKGKLTINAPDNMITVQVFCSHPGVDTVRSLDGRYLENYEMVLLGNMVKPVIMEGQAVILVQQSSSNDGRMMWKTCTQSQINDFEEMRSSCIS